MWPERIAGHASVVPQHVATIGVWNERIGSYSLWPHNRAVLPASCLHVGDVTHQSGSRVYGLHQVTWCVDVGVVCSLRQLRWCVGVWVVCGLRQVRGCVGVWVVYGLRQVRRCILRVWVLGGVWPPPGQVVCRCMGGM